jgi:hypothetical protein
MLKARCASTSDPTALPFTHFTFLISSSEAAATISSPITKRLIMARVRGSSRTAPPSRVVKDADAKPPNADTATEQLRTARQLDSTAAALTGLSIQPRAVIQDWHAGRPSPGGNNTQTLSSNDNSQAMDYSRDNAEKKWKQAHKIREELCGPDAATFGPTSGRFSADELPKQRYEQHETRQCINEVRSCISLPFLLRRGECHKTVFEGIECWHKQEAKVFL